MDIESAQNLVMMGTLLMVMDDLQVEMRLKLDGNEINLVQLNVNETTNLFH